MPSTDSHVPSSTPRDGDAPEPPPPVASGAWASLERKLPLLISALLSLVVVVYGWATYAEVRDSAMETGTEHLRLAARQLADLSQTGTAARFATVRRLAADPVVAGALDGTDRGRSAAERALAAATPPADSIHLAWELWSADGTRRVAVGRPSGPRDLAELRPAAARAYRAGGVALSALYPSAGGVASWTVLPVSVDGRPVGLLAERRRLANATRAEDRIRGLTGQAVRLLFTSRGSNTWATLEGRPTDPPFALPAGQETFVVRDARGVVQYGAQAVVPGTPFVIVLTLPETAVLERPLALLRVMLATGLAVLVVGTIGAWLLSLHVTRPLRAITSAAEAVAGGDYEHRVRLGRRDELGRLGATFNAMARRIGESHTELARRVVQSASLAEALERRNDELRTSQDATLRAVRRTQRLQDVTTALAGALELESVVSVIVEAGMGALEAAACDIFIVDPEQRTLSLVRSERADGGIRAAPRVVSLDAASPLAEAARTGEAVYVASGEEWEARRGGASDAEAAAGLARVALPLVARGRALGAVRFRFTGAMEFDEETRAFLGALAQQCAQAMDRALLFDAAVHARNAAEQARHVAQSASQAKTAFLAMMSHELRTPLNAIGGYTELIELGIRGPVTEAQREDLVRIRRNQKHLLSIINDILNMSRIEAGQIALRPADLPVDAILLELESLAGPQIATKGLRYVVTGCGGGLTVRADPEKLSQVLLNLVSNAVRFTDAGGSITVSCHADVDTVHVRVTDTGIGIPPEKLDAIFRPFVQVDDRLTRRTGGTGLGLAIARDLMTAMEGRIAVESEVGVGSTFTLSLPRVRVGAAVASVAS